MCSPFGSFPTPVVPDQMQIAELYEAYYFEIRRYLARFVAVPDAEDLTQAVFVKISKGLKDFRGESTPRTWLFRIATNTLRDFMRSKSRRATEVEVHISPAELERYDCSQNNENLVEKGALRREMNECISEFIRRLPENYGTVLILSDLEGYTNAEIAEILEISLDNVKIRLHRARARLNAELVKGCDFSYNSDNDLNCQRRC